MMSRMSDHKRCC